MLFEMYKGHKIEIETESDIYTGQLKDVFMSPSDDDNQIINLLFESCIDQNGRKLLKTVISWNRGYRISEIS